MKVAFYDAKPYDRDSFQRISDAYGITIKYYETKLNEDTAAIAADIKEIYSEAKSAGFDPKYIRQMIRLRKLDPDELDEADELTQMYRNALGI